MRDEGLNKERPIAPHLQVYRWPITMAMSIAHRITGAALYFGTFFLTIWLISLAYNPEYYAFLQGLYISIPGKIIAFLYSFALMHHLYGGIRHLIWEAHPAFLEKHIANRLAWGTLVFSFGTTVLIWLIGYYY